jgi:glycosyltransferase involved in cell wall biosynthesis
MTDRESPPEADPLVSVVVPTYGRSAFLLDALQSVADQTYPRLELLVVDDHSPEPVASLVADLDLEGVESVECLRHETNRGANAARTTGIEHASGTYLAFLDDDDYWEPDKIRKQVDRIETAPVDVGVVVTGQRYVDGDGETTHVELPVEDGPFLDNLVRGESFGQFSALLVDSTVVDAAGTPDERLPSWQDREWLFQLSQQCEFATVPEPLTIRQFAGQEQITDDYEAKRDVSYPLLRAKHRSTARRRGRTDAWRFEATIARALAAAALQDGHYRDVLSYSARSLRYNPFVLETYLYLAVALGGDYTYGSAQTLKRVLNRLQHGSSAE